MSTIMMYAAAISAGCLACYIVIPSLLKVFFRWQYLHRIKENGAVCLTFDDGPSPETTDAILAILRKAGVHATFFMLGKYAEKYPELVVRIVEDGHDIGSHGYAHPHAWKTGPGDTYRDLMRGHRLFSRFNRRGMFHLFRPPYGKLNMVSLWYMARTKSVPVFWNVDPRDYRQATSAGIVSSVLRDIGPGSTVLLHDGIGHMEGPVRVTIPALKKILADKMVRKMTFKTVSEVLFPPPRHE